MLRNKQHPQEKKERDAAIFQKVIRYIQAKTYRHICIYYSVHNEVNTHALIQYLLKHRYNVYVPKVFPDGSMQAVKIETVFFPYEKFKSVRQPKSDSAVPCSDIDLIIAPCVAYNDNNYRIGYGFGFYDRFLACYEKDSICLGYSFQRNLDFQVHPKDIPCKQCMHE